jgi:CHAD domain-containing protein
MTKRTALRPDAPLDQALTAVARDILTKARDAIADPEKKTGEAIHDFRKSIKRWRSFLRLIEPHFGSERADISHEVTRWLTTISLWPFSGIEFKEISKALTEGYRRARKAMPENWQEASEEELHEFRKRTIDHRYQMELVEPLWPRMAKIWIDEAQRLRESIGQHRDLALLRSMTAPHQPLARFRSKLTPSIERRQKEHIEKAAKIAARVFADKPKAFQARIETLWTTGSGDD